MSEMPEYVRERPRKKNWWGRNWFWVIPVGCITPVVLCGGFIVLILGVVFGVMNSSDVYQEAVAKAKEVKKVQDVLGTPIEEGFFVTGNIQINGPNGSANLAIPQ
jgi:hypothetical protein